MTGIRDEIEIMASLQKPKKITLVGDDGKDYIYLVKPHDDLRKDARLMDCSSMINKILKSRSETRKRNLCTSFPRMDHHAFSLISYVALFPHRYPDVRCHGLESRMRYAAMGQEYYTTTEHSCDSIRASRYQTLCALAMSLHVDTISVC